MNKKLSDKDKEDWQNFLSNKEKITDKDINLKNKFRTNLTTTIDLHGFSLEEANEEIEKFIKNSFIKNINKIIVITGKGLRSKNINDPYLSKELSILKYSIPNFIKNNSELMEKILKIDESAVTSPTKGSFEIELKKNE